MPVPGAGGDHAGRSPIVIAEDADLEEAAPQDCPPGAAEDPADPIAVEGEVALAGRDHEVLNAAAPRARRHANVEQAPPQRRGRSTLGRAVLADHRKKRVGVPFLAPAKAGGERAVGPRAGLLSVANAPEIRGP